MPFGLTNAPATCQELINNVLRAHLDIFVIAYLDDILVYSRNKEEHVKHVQTVLTCLDKFHLRLKPEKCEFHKEEVVFLGHIVGIHGVKMDPAKIEVIKKWPEPTNVKQIQEFLGFSNFNRTFIEKYSEKALPLTKLTRKDTPFIWGTDQRRAFETIKQAQIEPPTLISFRAGEPMKMETDASDLAEGACITQLRDGKWHPIAYYSRKFSGPETRYNVHDKELAAIVHALKHWRVYALSCSELTIYTDHKNLTYFTTTKPLIGRHIRWSEELGQYKFKIVYTPGKENGRADALSRRSDLVGTKETIQAAILKQNNDGSLGPAQEINILTKVTLEVPKELQETIIRHYHDDTLHGHQGITRTMELIRRDYEFPKMKEKITAFIGKCADCQKNKHSTHAPYGEMQPIEAPSTPWEDIAMDFMTGLPLSEDPVTGIKYNAILVIICRLTKGVEIIPFKDTYTAKQLGNILLDKHIRHHGIPKTIISDRDKLFTSNYWTTLMATMGTKKKLSTAYHPQTDGQTERANRTIKTYLRIYSNKTQNNWVQLLPMAQLTYNNSISDTTKQTPFFANHGRHPNLFTKILPSLKTEEALQDITKIKKIHEEMKENIQEAQHRSISYNNKKRKMAPQLKRGDKVYLLTKNLRTKRPSKGLDHVKVGPFLVAEPRGPVNYKLELPTDAKIHPVFHISKLEPADPNTPTQKTFYYDTEEENEFEVERIEKHEPAIYGDYYLVKWKGYPETENTWEHENNLKNCQQKIKEYYQRNPVVGTWGKGLTRVTNHPPRDHRETMRKHRKGPSGCPPRTTRKEEGRRLKEELRRTQGAPLTRLESRERHEPLP